MKKVIAILLATLGAATAGAQPKSPAPVKIGVVTSFSGRFAEFGRQQKAGLETAIKEINAKGTVIELLMEDDASDVNKALAACEKLKNEGVPLVIGSYSSGVTKSMAQYLSREKVPFLVVTSSDDAITKPGFDYVFRLNQPASTYAGVLFDVFKDTGVKSVAILAGNSAFEKSVQTAALDLAKKNGVEVVENQNYDKGLTDFRPMLNGFKAKNPDAIFLVGYQEDSVSVVRQAKEIGLKAKIVAGAAAGFALPDFLAGAGPATEDVVASTTWVPELKYPNADKLHAGLKAALGGTIEPSYHAAQAYAGVIVAADAVKRGGGADREAMNKALLATDLSTAYGKIKFESANGYKNQNVLPMVAQQVQSQGGKLVFVPIYPKGSFPGKLVFPSKSWSK